MSLATLSPGKNVPEELNVIIEISPKTGRVKYEVDKESGLLCVDRFMATTMIYPCLYGYVPSTLGEDGDPLDVLILSPELVLPGTLMTARPVGMLNMDDESGGDAKILALPTKKACPQFAHMETLEDIPKLDLDRIGHFFAHYKDLEPNKWVKIKGWEDKEATFKVIHEGVERYQSA